MNFIFTLAKNICYILNFLSQFDKNMPRHSALHNFMILETNFPSRSETSIEEKFPTYNWEDRSTWVPFEPLPEAEEGRATDERPRA
jgi:hypothetical protein